MRILALLSALLLASELPAGTLRVSECRGAHGERVFSDRDCPGPALRTLELRVPAMPAVAPAEASRPPRTRARQARPARAPRAAESFLCSTPTRSWYQHRPCREDSGPRGRRESLRQQRVGRAEACREIARPAAALRRGSERDERAGPYAKAMGRDPCS